jgi:hypothetical protein
MAGRKLFTNRSTYGMQVTLVVRASSNPRDTAGKKDFFINPKGSQWQEYGNNVDIYLNGINLAAVFNGEMQGQQYVVIQRGSPLDNKLNQNNGVDFNFANDTFYITTRQVS